MGGNFRLSSDQVENLLKLHNEGYPERQIAHLCKCTIETVRAYTIPGYREARNEHIRKHRAYQADARRSVNPHQHQNHHIKSNPLYDPCRDGIQKPASLTAALMGDPPPGRHELLKAWAEKNPARAYFRISDEPKVTLTGAPGVASSSEESPGGHRSDRNEAQPEARESP